MKLRLYNTLSKKVEDFNPIKPPTVGMYTCGQTVYDYAHIGHGRKYSMDDVLRRTLTYFGYHVTHVQNVTDVGHLVSDADEGEDKIEKGAKKSGKSVWEVANYFTDHFYRSLDKLNILRPDIVCKATEHIDDQIKLIERILANGHAYDTPEAVYFDVASFTEYGNLFGQKLEDKKRAAREEVRGGEFKKNPADFVLWFKQVGRFADHVMHWNSPWGEGFPGWHIECSAMSIKYLGEQFDIHTGGQDHQSVHHPNEIAQSEAATEKVPFVKYWIHYAFLTVDGQKMSKSLGNFYKIEEVEERGIDPMALRYLYLTAHYRKPMNFTWDSLRSASEALAKLRRRYSQLTEEDTGGGIGEGYINKFDQALCDDLNLPVALSIVWEVLKSELSGVEKKKLLDRMDLVLGLKIAIGESSEAISLEINELLEKRKKARAEKNWVLADDIRGQIESLMPGKKVVDENGSSRLG